MTPSGVVFDHTALLGLGAGTPMLSRIVAQSHYGADRYVYVPALCLSAAVAERPALAEHIGALPAVEILELGYAAAAAVGRLVAGNVDWRLAQAVDAGCPSVDWPQGRIVVTSMPDRYRSWPIDTITWKS